MDLELIKQQYPEIPVGSRAQNLTGKTFNNWKVLYRTYNKKKKVAWVCQCQCDKKTIRVVMAFALTSGTSKDCGCGRNRVIAEKADKKIHKRDEKNNIILKKCFRCNKWLPLSNFWISSYTKDGYSGECKNCQNTAKENRYNKYKKEAKRRGLTFELTKDDFYKLTSQDCYYCGNKLESYNGIDRVDSSQGYFKENCVPCCTMCNRMKLNYDVKDWINQMKKNLISFRRKE